MNDVIPEQAKGSDKKQIFVHKTEVVNEETGEIKQTLQQQGVVIKKEPDYIKLYLGTMVAFQGISTIPIDILMSISEHITYANDKNLFIATAYVKKEISQKLDISLSSISRYIKKLVDAGILFETNCKANYLVNPWLLAKGE